jgi:hypothetical protein
MPVQKAGNGFPIDMSENGHVQAEACGIYVTVVVLLFVFLALQPIVVLFQQPSGGF